ncbi:alpha/beta hydrolase [Crossiella sp. CA-258035]|uniref:alpha/beta fold hydrolase n=1 Tax=Crossiella sp. CA-258035 TaxID=2981138 RepID=UPI0024BC9C8A|nr:alpha/beta hydrolase [Crossiella sp. CA-258035]WHT17041.1 alpha/beta hydrolase [Crossiella sp. CA-258035]
MEIRLGELTFDVAVSGPADGEVVLLLHGFPQSHHCWDEVVELLNARGYRTVAPDQRGYSPGARPAAVDGYDIPLLAADAVGILDALEVPAAHVVGHDWGAIVAWNVAVRHPDRTRTLTALSVPHPAAFAWAREHDADQQARSTYIDLFRTEGKAEDVLLADGAQRLRETMVPPLTPEQAAPHLALLGQRAALTGALNWYRAIGPELGELGPVTVPTTYLWSTEDRALGRAGAQRCGQHVTGSYRFVEVEGITHWIPEQAPKLVAEEIVRLATG